MPDACRRQLLLERVLGQRRAVDGDEPLVAPAAVVVDGGHDELLARAALTDDECADVVGRQTPDHLVDLLHRGRFADEVDARGRGRLLRRPDRAIARAFRRQCLSDDRAQLIEIERLGQVLERARADRVNRGLTGAIRGHHDHVEVGIFAAQLLQRLQTIDAGHADIHDHEIRIALADHANGVLGIARDHAGVPFVAEKPLEGGGNRLVVVDDKNLGHGSLEGQTFRELASVSSAAGSRSSHTCLWARGAGVGCVRRALRGPPWH